VQEPRGTRDTKTGRAVRRPAAANSVDRLRAEARVLLHAQAYPLATPQPWGTGYSTASHSAAPRRAEWSRGESNPRPPPCKGGALPTKLRPRDRRAPTGVGVPGIEPGTSVLSGPRSNRLSYTPQRPRPGSGLGPEPAKSEGETREAVPHPRMGNGSTWKCCRHGREPWRQELPRKEVIQPHLPVRLPCYDFVPIAGPTLDGCLSYELAHRLQASPTFMT
jgi:hypothetical protein